MKRQRAETDRQTETERETEPDRHRERKREREMGNIVRAASTKMVYM